MRLPYQLGFLLLIHYLFGTTDAQLRIVGGVQTTISQRPPTLALMQSGKYYCAASLITTQHALTAAHCLYDTPREVIIVIGGVTDLRYRSSGQRRRVERMWIPRAFNPTTKTRDVGVIKMVRPMVLGPNVAIMPLATTRARGGARINVSGWGTTNERQKTGVDILRTVTVSVVPLRTCAQMYGNSARLTNTMMCAASRGRDACAGDSGGPAINSNGEQVGIVSFGRGCAQPEFPGVYTDIRSVLPFIRRCMAR
ncbi:trypsin alpha [Zeugodacus cucurbitae]|uniref:trypsin alpha n=1 Tax=Zeugodacus cucurbitae TaxID=28588 RepID=UPI0023D94E12|nr:trypsin alpha [Zeugodacus cucurbitae]